MNRIYKQANQAVKSINIDTEGYELQLYIEFDRHIKDSDYTAIHQATIDFYSKIEKLGGKVKLRGSRVL